MPRLLGKCLKILDCTGIGRKYSQYLATCHVGQCLFSAQYRQWAVQSTCIKIFVKFAHNRFGGHCKDGNYTKGRVFAEFIALPSKLESI